MYCSINSVSVVFGIAPNSYLIQNIFYFHTYTHTILQGKTGATTDQ